MTIAIVNKFDGGHAEDLRTRALDQCESCLNFDCFSNPHSLRPYSDMVAEVTASGNTIDTYKMADVVIGASGFGMVGLGQKSASDSKAKFLSKDLSISDGWIQRAEFSAGVVDKGTLVVYKTLAYAVGNQHLLELTDATTITDIGSVGGTSTCKPFVHPQDNVLYGASGYKVWSYNGSALTVDTTLIPTNMTVVSITDYGSYLALGCQEANTNRVIVYLWGRDMTLNTLQESKDFGIGTLGILENLGDILVVMMTTTSNPTMKYPRLIAKTWAGGQVNTIKEISIGALEGWSAIPTKAKSKDRVFFGFERSDAIYSFGKNKEGLWSLAKDRYIYNSAVIGTVLASISIIDDTMWAGFTDASNNWLFYKNQFSTNNPATDYTVTSVYKTTINPAMGLSRYTLVDKHKKKKLNAMSIKYTGLATSGTIGLSYSVDGSAFVDVISQATVVGEATVEATVEADGTPFKEGREFQFKLKSVGGASIEEFIYDYTPIPTQI